MNALTFEGVREVRYRGVENPRIETPKDVVVEVELAALCGSDLHPYHGRETGLDRGTILGHELVGRVLEAGARVERFRPGARVVSPFSTSCGECFFCRLGLTARCERGELLGWVEAGRGLHGAQAERVRVPLADTTLVEVPQGVASELALLAGDVLATGLFVAELGGVSTGAVVAVVGCGPVGLAAVVAARELGAEKILAIDSIAARLALATRLGAEALDLDSESPLAVIEQVTGGRGADVVLEAVGSPEATRLAVDLARPGATVAAAGVHTEETFAFSPGEAYDMNLTYRAGRCSARTYLERALGLARDERYPLAELITHRLPLSEGARAYELFDRKEDGCVKLVLVP